MACVGRYLTAALAAGTVVCASISGAWGQTSSSESSAAARAVGAAPAQIRAATPAAPAADPEAARRTSLSAMVGGGDLEPQPLDRSGGERNNNWGLVFDGGAPNLLDGVEATNFREFEDFEIAAPCGVTLYYFLFWTLELPNAWDGTITWQIRADNAGSPGAVLHSGAGFVWWRFATGRTFSYPVYEEYEWYVSFNQYVFLPQGRYWLALHLSADCSTRDEVYWETTSNTFGSTGHADQGCDEAGIADHGGRLAFELYAKPDGGVAFDGGPPSLANGNEMTQWVQADDFMLPTLTELRRCTFWTFDSTASTFDGTFQWWIHEDAGGQPGAVMHTGFATLERAPTGRVAGIFSDPEYRNSFQFPYGVVLTPGNYWLALKLNNVCTIRQNIYWSHSLSGFGAPGRERFECGPTWFNNGQQHAFVLCGDEPFCPYPVYPYGPEPFDGDVEVSLTPTLRWNTGCPLYYNIFNGGFEYGDSFGWGTVTGPGAELTPWQVATGGVGWFGDDAPFDGSYYAINGFDGDAGLFYELHRELELPITATSLHFTWRDRVRWDGLGISSTQPRRYEVTLQPAGGGPVIATLHQFEFFLGTSTGDTGYVTRTADLSAFAGQIVRIVWRQEIPETFTGPAQFQIDEAVLSCEAPAALGAIAADAARAFDASFERAKAAYLERREQGAPRALEAAPNAIPGAPGESQPLAGGERYGFVVFDGGSPDLATGFEMTLFSAANDFVIYYPHRLSGGRFWTLEVPGAWQGDCTYSIRYDNGGEPGDTIFSGSLNLNRIDTGRSVAGLIEYENTFSFPAPGHLLPAGAFWLELHMSSGCGTSLSIFWESGSPTVGAGNHYQSNCTGPWATNAQSGAFQLFGKYAGFFGGCCDALYGASTGTTFGNGPSNLYLIDRLNGASVLIGAIGFNGVTGLAFDPIGRLYGSVNADNIYGSASSALITIDPYSGAGTLIGRIGSSFEPGTAGRMPDISFDRNGVLYGYGDITTAEGLYRINTLTGAGTLVGVSGFFGGGNGLAFAPDGRLFSTPFDNQCLVELNPVTGAGVCVPGSSGLVPSRVSSLAFCADDGVLYGSWNDGNDAAYLVTIDPATGSTSVVGQSVLGLDALAFPCLPQCTPTYEVWLGNFELGFEQVCSGLFYPECVPGRLFCNTRYYWYVLSSNGQGQYPGPWWTFRTGDGCPGDANADGFVSFADVTTVLLNWLSVYLEGYGPGDANCDGEVNFIDVTTILLNYLSVCPD